MNKKYNAYLLSENWKIIRDSLFKKRGKKCERCGSKNRIQVHHKTYQNVYKELPEDLEILCHRCHQNEHHNPQKKRSLKKSSTKTRNKILKKLGYNIGAIKKLSKGKKVNTKFFLNKKSCLDKRYPLS